MVRLVFLFLFVTTALPVWAGAEGRLFVAAAVCVDGPVISLGQLVRAEGGEAAGVLARIGAEPLLAAPKFDGARANLSGPKLRDLIMARFGPDLPEIVVPDRVQVQRGGQVIDGLGVRPLVDKVLTQSLAHLEGEVVIRDYRLPDHLFVPEKAPVQVRIAPVGPLAPGRTSLRLEAVTASGKVARTFTGTVFVDVWKTVPCAARVLNRGNILEPELVTFARKNLAFLPRLPWDGRDLPLRVTSAVGTNQVIYADAVEPIPVIQKGASVTLTYEGRTLKLSVPAESLEDGSIGSVIRVRNMQSGKVVAARVLDANTVRTQ
ncbi:MAG: flagellar basal body P-ring formation protein FlgA [Deltaproteobacteria bacterium]|nr:flagellar basal body P-ring formation protein FlgA [Deltaproteobacteria bacterium]